MRVISLLMASAPTRSVISPIGTVLPRYELKPAAPSLSAR